MDLEILDKEPGQSISQWVYAVLNTNIIKLHLTPGSAISESEIAEHLAVSRTPIREAFIRLVEDGLLETYPQKGSIISLIDIEQAEDMRFARKIIEKAVVKEACEQFDERCLFDLTANMEMQKFCRKRNNYERMFELDDACHHLIYRGCGRERIWLHLKKMAYNIDRLRILRLSSGSWNGIIQEHQRIVQLVIDQNPGDVDRAIDEHLARYIVNVSTLQHPEYFKQDIHTYAC
jgi:DNA-binding GntR family transcriptional regulator